MTLYASFENGLVTKVTDIIGDYSDEQRRAEGLYYYEVVTDADYDPATHKQDGTEVALSGATVTVRPKIVAKTALEIYEDKVEMRRRSVPSSTERIEVMASVIDKLIAWVDLRAVPGDPSSLSAITDDERNFVKMLADCCADKLLPQKLKE
jgi:hypothetical protein